MSSRSINVKTREGEKGSCTSFHFMQMHYDVVHKRRSQEENVIATFLLICRFQCHFMINQENFNMTQLRTKISY